MSSSTLQASAHSGESTLQASAHSGESTLLVALITKNNGSYLPRVLDNVERYASVFRDYFAIVIDGYSVDQTFEVASEWKARDPSKRQVIRQPSKGLPRPLSLSEARNTYMTLLEDRFGPDTYLLILDADEVNSEPVSLEDFTSCWSYTDWDMMAANQSKVYYDIWALRHQECPNDCWDMVRLTGDKYKYIDRLQIPKPKDHPIIECQSCFGGAAIYRTEKLTGLRYFSFISPQKEICEHVPFHSQLKSKGGKIFINPRWINTEGK